MALAGETDLRTLLALIVFLKKLETDLGREKTFRNGPRIIDIDILFYDDLIFEQAELTIPHPRLHERAFVLVPLNDIAPELMHPVLKRTVCDLLKDVDTKGVKISMDALIKSLKTEPALAWKLAVNVQGHAPNSSAAKKAAKVLKNSELVRDLFSWRRPDGRSRFKPYTKWYGRTGSSPCWRIWAIRPGMSSFVR